MPTPTAGRYLASHFWNSLALIGNLGETAPHLLILPSSRTRSFPVTPSSMNSNSPMYLLFCSTRMTSLASLEAGMTTHSFLCLISEFCRAMKRFARMLVTGTLYPSPLLGALPEGELLRDLSKTLPPEEEVLLPYRRSV